MNLQRFMEIVPTLYEDWGLISARPRDQRFAGQLARVRGMTSPGVLQMLNAAVACLELGEDYGEVGCFQGATLTGALLGHGGVVAHAADNFSEFDHQGLNRKALRHNLATSGVEGQVRFSEQDSEEFLPALHRASVRLGVYLYDGAHDYRSQLMGLLLAMPLLASRALIVVDDSNTAAAKQACWDFMAARPECRLLIDLPTPGNGHASFWNGLYVMGWEAGSHNGYGPEQFRRARHSDLLSSLSALQVVSVRTRPDST